MSLCAAEAQVRMRHPGWGIVARDGFIRTDSDPQFRGAVGLRGQARDDRLGLFYRAAFAGRARRAFARRDFRNAAFIDRLCLGLPAHAASGKLTVEISSIDAGRDTALVKQAARQLERCNVAISIDDVMAETSWIDIGDFPIAELQVGPGFISGCSVDRDKRAVCGKVLSIAERIGARTTAKGLDASADFRVVCDMGFDLGQGAPFAKPMEVHRFARTVLRGHPAALK